MGIPAGLYYYYYYLHIYPGYPHHRSVFQWGPESVFQWGPESVFQWGPESVFQWGPESIKYVPELNKKVRIYSCRICSENNFN